MTKSFKTSPVARLPLMLGLGAIALSLAACTQTAPETAAPVASTKPAGYAVRHVAPAGYTLPQGGGCSGAVARYQAVMDNDYATGNVNIGVFNTISSEIATARAACEAGRDGEAIGLISSSRARHGYPAG